jgi:hypothetical protein
VFEVTTTKLRAGGAGVAGVAGGEKPFATIKAQDWRKDIIM